MSSRATSRAAAITMAVLVAVYLVFATQYAILLIQASEPIAKALGVALIVLPVIGVWVLVSDVVFVIRGDALLKKLGAEGGLPVDDLPKRPSGRPEHEAADAQFPRYQAEVEAAPQSWRAWLRLSLAYDASGDRRRARWAARKAISLERADA